MSGTTHFKTFHYETALEWQRRTLGRAMVPENPPIDVSPPPELGGEPGRWTPEQLLLASVEACTLFTLLTELAREHLDLVSWESTTDGTIGHAADGRFEFTSVVVRPVIEVKTERDAERVRAVLATLGSRCFIGSSLKAEPRIEARIVIAGALRSLEEVEAANEGPSS